MEAAAESDLQHSTSGHSHPVSRYARRESHDSQPTLSFLLEHIVCSVSRVDLPVVLLTNPSSRRHLALTTMAHVLHFPVFLLQLPLHLEIELSFSLYTLLLHITDNTLVHRLSTHD